MSGRALENCGKSTFEVDLNEVGRFMEGGDWRLGGRGGRRESCLKQSKQRWHPIQTGRPPKTTLPRERDLKESREAPSRWPHRFNE